MLVIIHNTKCNKAQIKTIIKMLSFNKVKGTIQQVKMDIIIIFKDVVKSLIFTYKLLFVFNRIIDNKQDKIDDKVVETIIQYMPIILNNTRFEIILKISEKIPICIGVLVFF